MAENSLRLQVPLAPALLENSMKKLEKALQPDYEDVVNSILNLVQRSNKRQGPALCADCAPAMCKIFTCQGGLETT